MDPDIDRRWATGRGHLLSAVRSADRRCPPADQSAAMGVEAAAEAPQVSAGRQGTGCRTPDRSGSRLARTPASVRRRTWSHRTRRRSNGRSSADGSGSLQLPLSARQVRTLEMPTSAEDAFTYAASPDQRPHGGLEVPVEGSGQPYHDGYVDGVSDEDESLQADEKTQVREPRCRRTARRAKFSGGTAGSARRCRASSAGRRVRHDRLPFASPRRARSGR